MGRTGTVNPVIHFKPVRLEGTTVSQATGNNVSFMEKHHLTVGSDIEVYKANKIIPTIARNTHPVGQLVLPRICPSCGTPLQIVESKQAKVLYCMNKDCIGRDIKHFTQFVSKEGMNIDGISEKKLTALINMGYIPSFCTACYREGRTGDRFMSLCKSGQIQNCCHPNALMTLKEFLTDYASPETVKAGEALIEKELKNIPKEKVRNICIENLKKIEEGQRDFRF